MRLRPSILLALTVLWASPALAVPVDVFFSWGTGANQQASFGPEQLGETDLGDGVFGYEGTFVHSNPAGPRLSWDVTAKQDPFIDGVFAVTNNHPTNTQTYTIIFTLPIVPQILPSSLTGASVAATLTVNPGGGTLGHNGTTALFTALIDGSPYDTLLPFDSSTTRVSGSGSAGDDEFGLVLAPPFVNQPGPAILSSIGIQITFTLTPGDSASFTSRFEVVPVPEPSIVAFLLGGGLMALSVLGRRN